MRNFLIFMLSIKLISCQSADDFQPYKMIALRENGDTSYIQIYDSNDRLRITVVFLDNKRFEKTHHSGLWHNLTVRRERYVDNDTMVLNYLMGDTGNDSIIYIATYQGDTLSISRYRTEGARYWGGTYEFHSNTLIHSKHFYVTDSLDSTIIIKGNDTIENSYYRKYPNFNVFNLIDSEFCFIDTTFKKNNKNVSYICDINPLRNCDHTGTLLISYLPYKGKFLEFGSQ